MKYIIMCGGKYDFFKKHKALSVVNNEILVARTIRLLKENGITDISISSNLKEFDLFGVPRLEHINSYQAVTNDNIKGYWLDAYYPTNEQCTYLHGDVYFTDEAIKKMVNYNAKENTLIGNAIALNSEHKNWGEPFGYIVVNQKDFQNGIKEVKKLQDAGKCERGYAISWELYRYLNGLDINKQYINENTYLVINDETDDVDNEEKIKILNNKLNNNIIRDDVIFYYRHLNYIGGIETWLYEIAKKYGEKRNITLVYGSSAPAQLRRIRKYVRCIKYNNQAVECNNFIFCFDFSIIKSVKAKEYTYFIHADYKAQNLVAKIPSVTTRILAVSDLARDSFEFIHKDQLDKLGLKVETCYNPIKIDKPERVITLISPTRLTAEKGGERMVAMAKRLKEREIPYIWFVYSDRTLKYDTSNFIMLSPELNVRDYIANADYLVQLSDTEGYAYSLVEALCLGTPIICTRLPILKEMKIKDGENAFILEFDLSNIDEVIDKMYNNNLKGFKYIPNQSNKEYLKILGAETDKRYKFDKIKGFEVIVEKPCFYTLENKQCEKGDYLIIENETRLDDLVNRGYVKLI